MSAQRPATAGRSRRPGPLQRLDRVVVPRLQRAARGTARGLGAPLRAITRLEDRTARRTARAVYRHRQAVLLVAAAIAFAGSYVHLQRYPELRSGTADAGPLSGGAGSGGTTSVARGRVTVGPPVGADVAAYIATRHAALAATEGDASRLAVVSFEQLLTGQRAEEILPEDVQPVLVLQRVPAEGELPFTSDVGGDLAATAEAGLAQARERVASEETEVRRYLESGTVTDPEFLSAYQADLDRLAATRNLLDTGTGTVFAVVVEAPLDGLRALPQRDGVRLVDLAPDGTELDNASVHGLLPSDQVEVTIGAVGR